MYSKRPLCKISELNTVNTDTKVLFKEFRTTLHFQRKKLVANQDGGILTYMYFDEPWKIEDLTKSKTFCGKLLQKISCIILGIKQFNVR